MPCVKDRKPRQFSAEDLAALRGLADQAEREVERFRQSGGAPEGSARHE